MGINIRGSIFGFWLGRVAYNYITNPHRTTEEFKSITISEIRDRMLSSDYLTTWAGRFIFQFFCVMVGITILYSIGASENTLFSRSFVNSSPLDDLNDLVQSSISENFVWKYLFWCQTYYSYSSSSNQYLCCLMTFIYLLKRNKLYFLRSFEELTNVDQGTPLIYLFLIFLKYLFHKIDFWTWFFCLFRTWFLQATQAVKIKLKNQFREIDTYFKTSGTDR